MSDTAYAGATRTSSTPDRLATVLLLVGLLALVPIGVVLGLLLAMASDSCGVNTCNETLIGVGVIVSAAAPVVAFLVTLVWVVVRWVRRRTTWWVPLAGLLLGALGWGLGAVLAFSSVG